MERMRLSKLSLPAAFAAGLIIGTFSQESQKLFVEQTARVHDAGAPSTAQHQFAGLQSADRQSPDPRSAAGESAGRGGQANTRRVPPILDRVSQAGNQQETAISVRVTAANMERSPGSSRARTLPQSADAEPNPDPLGSERREDATLAELPSGVRYLAGTQPVLGTKPTPFDSAALTEAQLLDLRGENFLNYASSVEAIGGKQ